MHLKILKNLLYKGRHLAAGTEAEVEDSDGRRLVSMGKAEQVEAPAPKPKAKPKAAPRRKAKE